MTGAASGEHVLVVDDDPNMISLLVDHLPCVGYTVSKAADGLSALRVMTDGSVDLVVTDIRMPGLDGISLLAEIQTRYPETPVILMTAFGTIENAVEAMRRGATDYVSKPFALEELVEAIGAGLRQREQRRALTEPEDIAALGWQFEGMIGRSEAMRHVFRTIKRAASSTCAVLLTGESGTGKEMTAKAIHARNPTREGPFVVVDCSELTASLLESELFGHSRGAFTDASSDHEGLIERARGGTVFLDEVSCLDPAAQAKLLRVVQEHTVRRLGSSTSIDVDLRFVAATNANLRAAIGAGRFREDLYFRLNVVEIHLPPLRDRTDDIPLLTGHLFNLARREHAECPGRTLDIDMLECLLAYSWPGNVRELANAIQRALVVCPGPMLRREHLPAKIRNLGTSTGTRGQPPQLASLSRVVDRHIRQALAATGGNRTEAAKLLGIGRRTLRRHLAKKKRTD